MKMQVHVISLGNIISFKHIIMKVRIVYFPLECLPTSIDLRERTKKVYEMYSRHTADDN